MNIMDIWPYHTVGCLNFTINVVQKHISFQCRVASSIIGGGGLIFIYSCSALLISFEIDCFYGL